ncbi:hypothetical protein CBR_g3687 [Chara braunii]|uniref:Uncharacterized protein n=1 Tax=Chara braunii TaxID=69332 RepID=A0A388KG45_CHABU|nr:hypothetical protein CBR_g3687 [Chara braunii]|eukprot:GBG68988.1 hypothetical protein CBR_g3687 [Chara braunii]
MMELALAGKYELQEDPLAIENGALQVGKHEKMIGGVYLLANELIQEETVINTVLDQEEEIEPEGGDNVIHEREDDDFEEGEIKEAFRAEEYKGVHLELGMLLSCEMRCLRASLTPLGAAMPRGRGAGGSVEIPLGATRQRTRMRTRRENRPSVFQGGNIKLILMEFERHAREFGRDSTRMLREVRVIGEWADPIANLVRESLSWPDFGRKMEGLHPSPQGRDGQPIRFDFTNSWEFLWAYDRYADELDIPGEQRVRSFLLFVRHHIRSFVRSIVGSAMNWGHCKKLLWNYYTPARQTGERRGMKKRRREPEAEERGTFEQDTLSEAQREERRKEHKSHRHERAEGVGGLGAPPQPDYREVDHPMPYMEPDRPQEPHVQEQREVRSAEEKELDRKERAAREQEIRTQLRMKNLTELHERMQQGKGPEEVEDRKGKGTCTQEEDPPLFSEVWMGFDKLMDATGRSGGQQQEKGVKLVSTDLLNLKGMMREGFAAARASDQKIGDRLTKVAPKAYSHRVDWEREAEDLKKELERQGKELEAVKADMEKVSAENKAVRQINQPLNKVTDALRAYLCAQLTFFQVKETEWEKKIRDLEAKYAQQAPTRVVDWTEVQRFEIRKHPVEEVLKKEKEVEKADQQEGEEIPLIDKEILKPSEALAKEGTKVGEFEWRMPAGLTLGHEPAVPQEGPPVEAMGVEVVLPTTQEETMGQSEGQESMGQTMAGLSREWT